MYEYVRMLLADQVKSAETVKSLEDAEKSLKQGKLPVLLPSMLLEEWMPWNTPGG